ncbi:MAG: DNA-binding protein [Oscillospiraceae bacterium]|nr:DNA-binding protein [Oscillospiraceae bacterium]
MHDMDDAVLQSVLLYDVYGSMLTEKQRNIYDLHLNQDLSLGEIAELEGITRQGVRDSLVRGRQTMEELDERLCLLDKDDQLDDIAEQLEDISRQIAAKFETQAAELTDIASKLRKIL